MKKINDNTELKNLIHKDDSLQHLSHT